MVDADATTPMMVSIDVLPCVGTIEVGGAPPSGAAAADQGLGSLDAALAKFARLTGPVPPADDDDGGALETTHVYAGLLPVAQRIAVRNGTDTTFRHGVASLGALLALLNGEPCVCPGTLRDTGAHVDTRAPGAVVAPRALRCLNEIITDGRPFNLYLDAETCDTATYTHSTFWSFVRVASGFAQAALREVARASVPRCDPADVRVEVAEFDASLGGTKHSARVVFHVTATLRGDGGGGGNGPPTHSLPLMFVSAADAASVFWCAVDALVAHHPGDAQRVHDLLDAAVYAHRRNLRPGGACVPRGKEARRFVPADGSASTRARIYGGLATVPPGLWHAVAACRAPTWVRVGVLAPAVSVRVRGATARALYGAPSERAHTGFAHLFRMSRGGGSNGSESGGGGGGSRLSIGGDVLGILSRAGSSSARHDSTAVCASDDSLSPRPSLLSPRPSADFGRIAVYNPESGDLWLPPVSPAVETIVRAIVAESRTATDTDSYLRSVMHALAHDYLGLEPLGGHTPALVDPVRALVVMPLRDRCCLIATALCERTGRPLKPSSHTHFFGGGTRCYEHTANHIKLHVSLGRVYRRATLSLACHDAECRTATRWDDPDPHASGGGGGGDPARGVKRPAGGGGGVRIRRPRALLPRVFEDALVDLLARLPVPENMEPVDFSALARSVVFESAAGGQTPAPPAALA